MLLGEKKTIFKFILIAVLISPKRSTDMANAYLSFFA